MGSYEPGEGWERVGLMGALIVSVVDLMGRKGEAAEKFKSSNGDWGARTTSELEATHPGQRRSTPMAGSRAGEKRGSKQCTT
tara:strand:+ start:2525 stop:2770 length:246 start_codon:yes stop_codon:yes gene_type:complete